MKKIVSVIGAIALIGASLVAGTTTSAQAAPAKVTTLAEKAAAAGTPAYYSPKDGVYFNNPYGDFAARQPIIDEVYNTMDSVPKGSKMRMAVYSWTREDGTDKAIAAYKRGVDVQIIVDAHSKEYPATLRLQKALGKDRSKKSFLIWCKQSCMSSEESLMHAKIYLFTHAGSSDYVNMIGSGNISTSTTSQAWNNMVTTVNNQTLYNSGVQYFQDMMKDKSWKNYYRTTSSGAYKEYFFPRAKTTNSDTMLNILNGVDCTKKPASGYGYKGKTQVKVGMYAWTVGRRALATKLVDMKRQGCDVLVTYSGERVEHSITQILLTKTSKGVIPIYNGRPSAEYNTPYMHHKNVLINGLFDGVNSKLVYAGTANFTVNTDRECNEIMIKINRADFYTKFDQNYNLVLTHTKKVTSMKGLMDYQGPDSNGSEGVGGNDFQVFDD